MAKKPLGIQVIEEGDERFLVKTFEDGSEERQPIVKAAQEAPKADRLDPQVQQRAQARLLAIRQ